LDGCACTPRARLFFSTRALLPRTSPLLMIWKENLQPLMSTTTPPRREQEETAGLYGLGINVNMRFPHTVRSSSGLQDATGKSIADSVAVHDTLTHVDEVPLEGYYYTHSSPLLSSPLPSPPLPSHKIPFSL
jgi:hypothetical protein